MNELVKVDNIDLKIEVIDNKPMVSSLDIAVNFEKRHDVVIRAIEDDDVYSEFLRDHKIVVSEYKVKNNNKTYKYYLLDRDTFSYYVMGFTGTKAKKWKLNYIKAFNMMEKQLKAQVVDKLPKDYLSALKQLVKLEEEKQLALAKIEEDKPKVEFASQVETSINSINIGTYAKTISEEHGIKIGQNKLFAYFRDNGILIKSGRRKNMPTQRYIDNEYFEVKVSTYETQYGTKEATTTLINGKGQVALLKDILTHFRAN